MNLKEVCKIEDFRDEKLYASYNSGFFLKIENGFFKWYSSSGEIRKSSHTLFTLVDMDTSRWELFKLKDGEMVPYNQEEDKLDEVADFLGEMIKKLEKIRSK